MALGLAVFVAGATTAAGKEAKAQAVPVKLLDFKVQPKRGSVTTGRPVKLKVKNVGSEAHEMVVVRTHGSPLPTKPDGSVDENAIPESDRFGEVVELQPKKSKVLTVKDVPAGQFVFYCNLVDKESDGTTLSHYAQGMHTDFSVVSNSAVVSTPTSQTAPPQKVAVRREYPAGGPTDPVFPPNHPTYELLAVGKCDELLAETQTWGSSVADTEGRDTTPLYMSAAYTCLGRWDEALRVFGQINVSQPDFGSTGHACDRKAVLEWLTSLVDARRRDPGFSPVFVVSSGKSSCVASGSTSTNVTNSPTSTTSATTNPPSAPRAPTTVP